MSGPRFPQFEPRQRKALLRELVERASVWLPEWQPRAGSKDFARALFEITARLCSEVTQRLDRVPEKSFRGFMHWLGVGGMASRAARVPVVFGMTPGAVPVDAAARVQLQALGVDPPLMMETERPLRILPGRLATLVAADPVLDQFYTAPAGPLSLEAPAPLPNEWVVNAFGDQGEVQFDQTTGVETGLLVLDAARVQHEVTRVDKGIVALTPSLTPGTPGVVPRVTRASNFDAFDGGQIDRQVHALYIGADSSLDVATRAVIEVSAQGSIAPDAVWHYWGTKDGQGSQTGWQAFDETVRQDGRLLLVKPAGKVEQLKLADRTQRWLRATVKRTGADAGGETGGIRLRINCLPADLPASEKKRLNDALETASSRIDREAVANTRPLVLDRPFYPLGREPRLFDAFYLGSKEMLSKANALATLKFEMGDQFGGALAGIDLDGTFLIVSVGEDGALRRLRMSARERGDEAAADAGPTFEPGTQPVDNGGTTVALQPGSRPGASLWNGAHVSVIEAAEPGAQAIWRYTDAGPEQPGTWTSLGVPAPQGEVTETLLVRSDQGSGLRVYAIAGKRLYRRDALAAGPWTAEVGLELDAVPVDVAKIVCLRSLGGDLGHEAEHNGLACISHAGDLFSWNGAWHPVKLDLKLDPNVYPLAVLGAEGAAMYISREMSNAGATRRIVAIRWDLGVDPSIDPPIQSIDRVDAELVGGAFGLAASSDEEDAQALVLFIERDRDTNRPVRWQPFSGSSAVRGEAPASGKEMIGAPLAAKRFQVVPAENGSVYVGTLEAVRVGSLADAVAFTGRLGDVGAEKILVDVTVQADVLKTLVPIRLAKEMAPGMTVLILEDRLIHPVDTVDLYLRLSDGPRRGEALDRKRVQLQPEPGDKAVERGDMLRIEHQNKTRVYFVDHVQPAAGTVPAHAVLTRQLPEGINGVTYLPLRKLRRCTCSAHAVLDVSALNEPALKALAEQRRLYLPSVGTTPQAVFSVFVDAKLAVLAWAPPAGAGPTSLPYLVDGGTTAWALYEPARPRNPDLSWEYWNGTGWWQIDGVKDTTGSLVRTGEVTFCVPADLAPTEVVGRTNHWVRARLVGGDYGQAVVTTQRISDAAGQAAPPTITYKSLSSIEGIRAPYVLSMGLAYEMCCPAAPEVVLAQDSAAFIDLSGANRTPGAKVAHFVPLAQSLAALSSALASDDGGKALYLGFDAPLQGGPISLLFLVHEGQHDDAFPLRVEVLRRNGFEPVVAEDGTRGLNESGTLSFALSEPPVATPLFGTTGYWLRLRPRAGSDVAKWRPVIRGAWLNATWAAVAETRTLELLGSSDGSPNQRMTLARPPVIADSLELRVREGLGDEDKDQLRRFDPHEVEDELGNRPGPWVRWTAVADTADAGPEERVYALDEAKGEIAFGDGLHGRIPPIGPDAVLAQRYRHGGGAAANGIAAWSPVSLVTPLQGVDRAIVPDGAAGGSDPQDAAAVMRYAPQNVYLRQRALTLPDVEVLTRQFSPDIAQTRALPTPQGLRLIVVMRGWALSPSQALRRELRRYLLARATPGLAEEGALQISGPDLVLLRVSLELVIDTVEYSGAVAAAAEQRVRGLLDAAGGGIGGEGWPLGRLPSDDDIAAALADITQLHAVVSVELQSVSPIDGALGAVPARLSPTQFVQLPVDGGVHCEIKVAESESAR